MKLSRDQALVLLQEYNENEALIRHALQVEAAMKYWALKAGLNEEEVEEWRVVGLLHDLDYEKWPEKHCVKSAEILRANGVDEELVRAVLSHGYGLCTDVEPVSSMEKTLYAVDELTGLIYATALMRPSRSVLDLELKSLKKKFKTPSFAAGVNREVIKRGAEMLGIEMDELMHETIMAMRELEKGKRMHE